MAFTTHSTQPITYPSRIRRPDLPRHVAKTLTPLRRKTQGGVFSRAPLVRRQTLNAQPGQVRQSDDTRRTDVYRLSRQGGSFAVESLVLSPTRDPRRFRTPDGRIVSPPDDWECLPPGDAGLTRRVKALGDCWTVTEKRGRKTFSHGVWASAAHVAEAKRQVEEERADPAYARRRAADAKRREAAQGAYVAEFRAEVLAFLAFAPTHADVASRLADAVTAHATPVGSGTVARTQRIPVEQRAEAAVIAWMRHQTTAYDHMAIARIKGKRREVRRMLAQQSKSLLDHYRAGRDVNPNGCPLQRALTRGIAASA
jgi:hypothetical protein